MVGLDLTVLLTQIRLYCAFTVTDYLEEKLYLYKGKILSMIF